MFHYENVLRVFSGVARGRGQRERYLKRGAKWSTKQKIACLVFSTTFFVSNLKPNLWHHHMVFEWGRARWCLKGTVLQARYATEGCYFSCQNILAKSFKIDVSYCLFFFSHCLIILVNN